MATTNPIVSKALNAATARNGRDSFAVFGDDQPIRYLRWDDALSCLDEVKARAVRDWKIKLPETFNLTCGGRFVGQFKIDANGNVYRNTATDGVYEKAINESSSPWGFFVGELVVIKRDEKKEKHRVEKVGPLGIKLEGITPLFDADELDTANYAGQYRASNDATGRTFKSGDKVRWEYVGGETDSGVVIADKGSYLEVKTESGEIAHPAKILIAKNASSRTFKPNDAVEWIDRHGNRNSGYYVRDNGPDRVTVSTERDGQGGGLEIPRAWIVENAAALNYSPYTKGAWLHDASGRNYTVIEEEHWASGNGARRVVTIQDVLSKQKRELETTELDHSFRLGEAGSEGRVANAEEVMVATDTALQRLETFAKSMRDRGTYGDIATDDLKEKDRVDFKQALEKCKQVVKKAKGDSFLRLWASVLPNFEELVRNHPFSGDASKAVRDIRKLRDEAWFIKNTRACNAKWVILYRDGGKEKIESPSYDAAKKVAEQKSQASGRGYISVIVDDGVDYGVNVRSRNSVVQKALNAVAKNYDVKPGWTTHWSGDLKEGTKVAVVDSPARYGGMEGVVLRKDGYKYAVRLADIAGMEVQLNPNQLAVKNAAATNASWTAEERKLLGQHKFPNGGIPRITDGYAEFIHGMVGHYWLTKKDDGSIAVSFTPTDPYEKGWYKVVKSVEEANRAMGVNAKVRNAAAPAIGSRWVHNDDNLFVVKVIGADGSSVRVQSADGGTCTYRLDEFLSDYRAANACTNAAVDVPTKFIVGGVYRAPWDRDWFAKVISRTTSSIKVATKSIRDSSWGRKDEQVTLRIQPKQSLEQDEEVAKGEGWEFWASEKIR